MVLPYADDGYGDEPGEEPDWDSIAKAERLDNDLEAERGPAEKSK